MNKYIAKVLVLLFSIGSIAFTILLTQWCAISGPEWMHVTENTGCGTIAACVTTVIGLVIFGVMSFESIDKI